MAVGELPRRVGPGDTATVGAALIAAGVAVGINPAVGLIVAGVELVGGAYVAAYMKARKS
jgi:hypothetical protein